MLACNRVWHWWDDDRMRSDAIIIIMIFLMLCVCICFLLFCGGFAAGDTHTRTHTHQFRIIRLCVCDVWGPKMTINCRLICHIQSRCVRSDPNHMHEYMSIGWKLGSCLGWLLGMQLVMTKIMSKQKVLAHRQLSPCRCMCWCRCVHDVYAHNISISSCFPHLNEFFPLVSCVWMDINESKLVFIHVMSLLDRNPQKSTNANTPLKERQSATVEEKESEKSSNKREDGMNGARRDCVGKVIWPYFLIREF